MLDRKEKERIFYDKFKFHNKDKHFPKKKKLDIDFGNGFGLKVLCIAIFLFLIISSFSITKTDENYSPVQSTQEQQNIEDNQKTQSPKIELVTQVETSPIPSQLAIIKKVNSDEATLKSVLDSNATQQEKDKTFLIFYRNLGFYIEDTLASGAISPDTAIEAEQKQTVSVSGITYKATYEGKNMSMEIISPKTPVFKTEWGFDDYSSLAIKHKYLYDNYSKYLSQSIKDFLLIKIKEDKDRQGVDYKTLLYQGKDYGVNMPENLKSWLANWENFMQKYPNFPLKGTIQDFCNAYKNKSEISREPKFLMLDELN